MNKIAVALLCCSILYAAILPAHFDWTRFVITVTTTDNTSMTELLYKALCAIQYDDEYTVADYINSHSGVDRTVTKYIQNFTGIQQNFLTDGGIEYIHSISLTDKIMHELLPAQHPVRYVVPMLCPCCGQKWPDNQPIPDTIVLIPQQLNRTDYTGIIFDCRGYTLTPCLFPNIVTDKGKSVYSVDFASVNAIIEWGLAQYTTNNDLTPPRTGRQPFVVKAVGTTGKNKTNIVISTADAQLIHGSKENVQLLKECRVVIVYSQ